MVEQKSLLNSNVTKQQYFQGSFSYIYLKSFLAESKWKQKNDW
jgi:hypothetical protein